MSPEETTHSQQGSNNPNPQNPTYQNYWGGNQMTPNSTAVLVLGILSIVMCWCYGLVSIVLGIVAIILANVGEREYKLNPQAYSISSYKNLKAGKTCAIIGLSLAGVYILCIILYIVLVGTLAFNFLNLNLGN